MADVILDDLEVIRPLGGVPFGNMTVLPFELSFTSGVLDNSDTSTAVGIGDVIIAGTIPEGFILLDAIVHSNGDTLGATNADIDVGFEYVDGEDVTALPEAVDCIFDGLNADAAVALTRMTLSEIPPIAFTKEAYLTAKVLTAALEGSGSLYIQLIGICDQ